jgi:hypothetical protein
MRFYYFPDRGTLGWRAAKYLPCENLWGKSMFEKSS